MNIRLLTFMGALGTLALAPTPAPALAGGLPLSPSQYGVSRICAEPQPGRSGCMGLRLVPDEPSAVPGTETTANVIEHNSPIKGSLTPANLVSAYGLTGAAPPGAQTIALVDAYDSATIANDLEVFSAQYGLPACNEGNGCFRKVNQKGKASPLPASSGEVERGWAQETATDVEVAHGVCPGCSPGLRLVAGEANLNENQGPLAGEQAGGAVGGQEVPNSGGG